MFACPIQLNGLASGGEVSEEALVMFTASLLESAANSSRPEDLPAFIALFQDTLQYLDNPSPATVQVYRHSFSQLACPAYVCLHLCILVVAMFVLHWLAGEKNSQIARDTSS